MDGEDLLLRMQKLNMHLQRNEAIGVRQDPSNRLHEGEIHMVTPRWTKPRDTDYAFLAELCKWAALSVLVFILANGLWEHIHPVPTYLDVVRECEAQKNGVAKVERNVRGEVIGIRCDHPTTWRL